MKGKTSRWKPDDMAGKHRDGEQNPLDRPQVMEKEENVVANRTSHAGQRQNVVFQAEVEMDLEASQVAARHFVLPIDRQQRGAILTSTDRGGDYPVQADFEGNPKITAVRSSLARRLRSTGISEG